MCIIGNNTVIKFAPGATTPSATLTGLSDPQALAVDANGNLYVANGGTTVSKFIPGATTPSATLTGLNNPKALAFDGGGNLYVVNKNNGTVSKFAPGATVPGATLTGLTYPTSLAFDSSGNLYVANYGNTTVTKFGLPNPVGGYTINDGNNGNNYAVTTVSNTTGVINKAPLTITASTNARIYDGTTTAAATPTVSGLLGPDTVTRLAESYDSAKAGSGKTLNANTGFTLNDGNGGNNYSITAVVSTTGVINSPQTGIVTSTTVQSSQASTSYGAPVTFTITVTAATGVAAPTGGVEVFDNTSHDLGVATFLSSNGPISTWTLTTLPKSLNVTSPAAHSIMANYTASDFFVSSSGTLANGQIVTPAPLTMTAVPNTKTYDAMVTAVARPTVLHSSTLRLDVRALADVVPVRDSGRHQRPRVVSSANGPGGPEV